MQIKCIFNTEVNSTCQFFTKICYILCPLLFFYIEVPQFIIQQRVDQAYDGGKPIWSKPAVVYVSGSVASVGVIILGIRKLYPYVKYAVLRLTFNPIETLMGLSGVNFGLKSYEWLAKSNDREAGV